MASCFVKLVNKFPIVRGQQIRYNGIKKHICLRSVEKLWDIDEPLEARLAKINTKDPTLYYKVNIGYAMPKVSRKEVTDVETEYRAHRKDPKFEEASRLQKLSIDLDKEKSEKHVSDRCTQLRQIADHYGIFDHLFGDAYFNPVVPLTVEFDLETDDTLAVAHSGNIIKPDEARNAPIVTYEAEKDSLWTLLLTTPDPVFIDEDRELCHWFIGNIPGNAVDKGEVLIDYLKPIPPRGVGYCRYALVLYKQNKKLDYSQFKTEAPCLNLSQRVWSTYDFYKERQENLTPAGLSFFQSDWDKTLKDFYHNKLDVIEPIFQYDFEPLYIKDEKFYPIKEPFNLYTDMYRDPKQINKEMLLKRLKKKNPFKTPDPPLKYPGAIIHLKQNPEWEARERMKEGFGWARFKELDREY